MTDKDKIRAEIERRLKRENEILWNAKLRGTYASPSCEYNLMTLTSLRDFIDSLPDEPDSDAEILIGDKDYACFHADVEELDGELYNYCQEQGYKRVKVIIVEDD